MWTQADSTSYCRYQQAGWHSLGTVPLGGNMGTVPGAHSCHWAGRSLGSSSSHRNRLWHTALLWRSCLNKPADMQRREPHTLLLSCKPCPVDTHLKVQIRTEDCTWTHRHLLNRLQKMTTENIMKKHHKRNFIILEHYYPLIIPWPSAA